jgi:hypothetical protein
VPIKFNVRIEMGDGKTLPPESAVKATNELLSSIKKGLELK